MAFTAGGTWTISSATEQEYTDAKAFAAWRYNGVAGWAIAHDDANKKVTITYTHPVWSIAADGSGGWVVSLA